MGNSMISYFCACIFLLIFSIVIFSCDEKSSPNGPDGNTWLPITENVNGELFEIEGLPVLRVWGTSYEQGYAQGYLYAETITEFLNQCVIDLGGEEFLTRWENDVLPDLPQMTIPQIYRDELRGIVEGMEARQDGPVYIDGFGRNLTYEDLAAAQCYEDILRIQGACCSFAAWGVMTPNGGTISGRNYDHPDNIIETDYRMIVVRSALESGELAWVSLCQPSEIGCTTGINEQGVAVSQHDGVGSSYIQVSNIVYPDGFVHRRAVETARAASAQNDVTAVFRSMPIASSCNPMVTWPYSGNGPASVVYEMDSDRTADGGVTIRETDGNVPYQITANHFLKRSSLSTPDYRYAFLDSSLSSIAGSGGSEYVSQDYAWHLLGETPLDPSRNQLTIVYAVVFEPNAMLMHAAFSENGEQATACSKITVDLNDLFNRTN